MTGRVLLLPLLAGCSARAEAPPDGWGVLAGFLAAVGGEAAVLATEARVLEGVVTASGQDDLGAPFSAAWGPGGRYTSVTSMPGGFRLEEGTDGTVAWARDPAARLLRGDEAAELARRADLHAVARASTWWADATLVGMENAAGRPAWRVRLEPHAGRPVDAWYDLETGLPLRTRTPGDLPGTWDEVRLSDWRPVDGVLVPFVREQDQDGFVLRSTVERAAGGPTPEPTLPPDIAAVVDPGGPVGEAALTRWNGLAVIAVQVGTHELTVVVDTGANTTVVDPLFVAGTEALRVPSGGSGGSLPDLPLVAVGDLAVGARTLPDRVAATADLVALFGDDGPRGILGADVLAEHVVDIDPATETVRLYPATAAPAPPPGTIAVPVHRFASGLLRVDATVGGRALPLLVDTGGSRTVVSWAAAPKGLVPGGEGTRRIGDAVGADGHLVPVYEAQVPGLDLGPLSLPPAPRAIANLPAARRLLGEGPVGVLGADVLLAGPLRIDGPGGTVWISPPAEAP